MWSGNGGGLREEGDCFGIASHRSYRNDSRGRDRDFLPAKAVQQNREVPIRSWTAQCSEASRLSLTLIFCGNFLFLGSYLLTLILDVVCLLPLTILFGF